MLEGRIVSGGPGSVFLATGICGSRLAAGPGSVLEEINKMCEPRAGKKLVLTGLLLSVCSILSVPAFGQRRGGQRVIQGTVVGISGQFAGRSRPFTLYINNPTPSDQQQRLVQALRSGGQDALLKTLSGMNAGRISIGNNVGVTAN